MGFTYTDSDKIVLEAWGKFKVTLLEAVEPGDLLSWYNTDNAYTVQFADQSDSQRADCIAVEGGVAGDTITACLKAELGTIPTIGTHGDPTTVYFAAAADFFGAPLYLGESGKPASSAGATYKQMIGKLLARDRILISVMPSNVLDPSTFLGTISPVTSDGGALGTASLMWSDLFLASGAVINFNNGDITLTHSSGVIAFDGGSLRVATDAKLEFRDTGLYINSDIDGILTFHLDGTGQTYSAIFYTGSTKAVYFEGYIQLAATATNGAEGGMLWSHSANPMYLEYYNGSEVRKILTSNSSDAVVLVGALTVQSTVTISEGNQLYFRNTNIYIKSISASQMQIGVTGTTESAIIFTCGAGGGFDFDGYVGLYQTDTDASGADGQMWYDISEKVIKFLTLTGGTKVRRLMFAESDGSAVTYGNLTIPESSKLCFRNANIYISDLSTTQMTIVSPGTTEAAIYISVGTGGGVQFEAYVGLKRTDTNGTEEGQIWYDMSEDKLKFKTAAGVETVTSS